MTNVNGKVALVTGGSRGIGLGAAHALAASGFHVAINGLRNPAEVADVVAELAHAGTVATYFQGDVADLADHARLLGAVRTRFGPAGSMCW
jgi:3-oxoacyl-[acyl-carrier protein] reductase